MKHFNTIKKITKIVTVVFTVVLLVLVINFMIHVKHVKSYNATERSVTNETESTEVLVDIHPRGQSTDSWEKDNAFTDRKIYAKIYEATITNSSKTTLHDWSLRIDITENCWINNAWNGTVEIHQFTGGEEKVQRLSLQNYEKSELAINYYIAAQDLLIPLSEGDYIIYYPSTDPSTTEEEIDSNDYYNGSVSPGIIFYSNDGDVNLSHYQLDYYLEKSIWTGTEPLLFMIATPIWCLLMLIFVIVSWLMIHFEKKMVIQNGITGEIMDVFTDFVDSRENHKEGHSRRVADISAKIGKELGMTQDQIKDVYYAGLFHDIGKVYVPDYILKKNKDLTTEETETLQQHTVKGAEMLKKCTSVHFAQDGAFYHHEHFDGTGYPSGKAGEEIPLIGRIIALADAYDILSTDEKYALRQEDILTEIEKEKGTRFDPVLVETLADILQKES